MANLLKRHEFWLGMFIIALCLLLGWRSEEFFTFGNIYDLANNYAMLTILACGLFVVLIAGGIDISFPAMTIIAQYGMVVMLQKVGGNFAVAFVLAGGIGVLLGLVNALLVNRLRVPSIIITISTLNIFYGLLLWLSKGVWLYDFPPWFEKGVMLFKYTDADGYDYGLGLPLLTMIVVVLLTAFIMNFTTVGRKIYAMGGNRESASRVGFSVLRLQLFVYGYMGLMSGAAGVVQAWTVMTVASDSLLGYELTVLAAVVLGGTSLIGGRGTLTGTLLGVILLAVMQKRPEPARGLLLLADPDHWGDHRRQHQRNGMEPASEPELVMKKSWRNNVEFYLIGLLLLMVIAFSIAMPNIFWSVSNFQSIASQMPVLGILALAMAMTMLCGGINLSIIATANACSLVMAWVATSYPPGGATALATLLAGGGAAMIIGLCNGILIAGIRVSPILATLGMMTLLKGINILITGGSAIANYPQWVLWLNHAQWFGIPLPMWLFAVVAAGLWVLLEKSPLGRAIMLIGSNERATHYSGINTRRVLMWVYVISALLCAVAAFLMMSKLNSAKASYGESYLLVSILAAVLGGVNPDGGSGRIVGMVLALFLLQIIESGFNILGISPYLTMALWGVLLLCFIQARGMLGLERAG
ncbi:ribose/xylose/arabinose/galactoside ABC transporter permease 1 [Klebsiella pneumoniae]|nr:ribose/xylose/arabinose/galactoside ABC transporter permease 1 [Klebsiella pneumoniae]